MFRGGNQNALPHEAGSVADALHVFPTGGYREVVEIGTAEYNSGPGRGRAPCESFTGYSRVKTDYR